MRAVVELLAGARRLVIFTGAGVSAESGIPTFRDALGGLWARYDPAALATPAAFADDPALVWGWYEWRRLKVLGVQPNPAHRAIAALSGRIAGTRLVTQNVDDLHERAGSRDVLHLHGSLHAPRCAICAAAYRDALPDSVEPEEGRRLSLIHISEPTRQAEISYAVFCLKKKKNVTVGEGQINASTAPIAAR